MQSLSVPPAHLEFTKGWQFQGCLEEERLGDRHPGPLVITKMQLNGGQDPLLRKTVHDLSAFGPVSHKGSQKLKKD